MTSIDTWNTFLERWDRELLPELKKALPSAQLPLETLRQTPASKTVIQQSEQHLQTRLPLSYRYFLQVSNGWILWEPSDRLFKVQEVTWFAASFPDIVSGWADDDDFSHDIPDNEYFVYGPGQDPSAIRRRYLLSTLLIGRRIDAFILLNPSVVSGDDEWEAWHFDAGIAGAVRYPSFWNLMKDKFESLSQLLLEINK